MMECKELAGKVVETLTLYEKSDYGSEVVIEFTDGTTFNVCLRIESFIEAKHLSKGDGEPSILRDYSCPMGTH